MCAHYESVHHPQRLRQRFGVDLPSELARRDVWPGHLSTFIVGPDDRDQSSPSLLGGRRRRSEMGENRGSLGSADEPRVGPWALEAMPGETGLSAIAAGALSAAQAPSPRQAKLGVFGLIPAWAQDPKIARHTYNARSETVAAKPSFRDAWRRAQHCIVPAEAIFEPDWRSGKAVAQRIGQHDGQPMGLAGLWSLWRDSLGTDLYSFTLLTVNADAHPFMSQFHKPGEEKRMVVVLPPERYDDWLQSGPAQAMDFLRPCPTDELTLERATP